MLEPKKLHIEYTIENRLGKEIVFDIRLNEFGLLEGVSSAERQWTRLVEGRCSGCRSDNGHCLSAMAVVPVVEAFHELDSLAEVRSTALVDGRRCELRCPAPRALASIMGLLIAASGCHKTMSFRAMALYHQPFATADETLTRAAGFWLVNLWAEGKLDSGSPFDGLIDAWGQLEEINQQLSRRFQATCPTDAAPNGLAFLDALAKIGVMGLESRLAALKPAFLSSQHHF